MALPYKALPFPAPFKPDETEPYFLTITQEGDGGDYGTEGPMLLEDEGAASVTLTPSAEAVAAGLSFRTTGGYATTLDDVLLTFWPMIDAEEQDHVRFKDFGVALGILVTVVTTSIPPRTAKRTVALRVRRK